MTILGHVVIKGVSGSRNSWSCFCSLVWVTVRFGFKVINPILFGSSIMFWNFQSNEPEPNQSSEEFEDLSGSYSHGFSRSASASLHHISVLKHCALGFFGLGGWGLHLSLLFDGSCQAAVSASELEIPQSPEKPRSGFSNCVWCGALCFLWRKKTKSLWFHARDDFIRVWTDGYPKRIRSVNHSRVPSQFSNFKFFSSSDFHYSSIRPEYPAWANLTW